MTRIRFRVLGFGENGSGEGGEVAIGSELLSLLCWGHSSERGHLCSEEGRGGNGSSFCLFMEYGILFAIDRGM